MTNKKLVFVSGSVQPQKTDHNCKLGQKTQNNKKL